LYDQAELAAAGSTGNNTHAGVHVGAGYEAVVFQFVVEAVGSTPTVTWKVQASPDDPTTVADAQANWYDVGYITDASDTISQSTRSATAVGAQIAFLSNPIARRYRRFRLVTSANTNVTYHCDIFRVAAH